MPHLPLERFTARLTRCAAVLFVPLFLACSPPSGPDFVSYTCVCGFPASQLTLPIEARICTNIGDMTKLRDDAQSQCDSKETTCFPFACADPIENCGFVENFSRIGVCPENSNSAAGGDFGQARAEAVGGSQLNVSGGDVDNFSVAPMDLIVQTTLTGDELLFADIAGFVNQINFSTPGGFLGIGGGDHTLSNVHLVLTQPFAAQLQPDGTFQIPAGAGGFIVSGNLDGDDTALAGTTNTINGVYSEEDGVFEMSGVVNASGADVVIGFDLILSFVNRPPRADAGPDQDVECTSTLQLGLAELSGLGSFDLDGNDDIDLYRWLVDADTDPSPVVVTGAEVTLPLALGPHIITLTVADMSGSSGRDTTNVLVEDTLPPVITIVEPMAIQYEHADLVTLDYDVADACTGVADVAALLDGSGMLAGHGLADGQVLDLLIELPLGLHTFEVSAMDQLGQPSMSSVTFEIIATPESMRLAIERFDSEGRIAKDGITKSLLKQLAAAADEKRTCETAANGWAAFIHHVEAQAGKSIDAVAAAILIADAEYISANCM